MDKMLLDKAAVITGGGRGIGRAIAESFLSEGAYVVLLDRVFPDDFENWKASMASHGNKIAAKTLDVTNTNEAMKLCAEMAQDMGRIDILVNNAGITRDRLLLRMIEEDWDAVLAVNLKGAFNMMKGVTSVMAKQRSGKVINISSVVGITGNAGQANYSASKAGLIGLSKTIARELAGRGICVNCVAPGFVETDMTAMLNDDQKNAMLSQVPMKRGCKPFEIANVVAFLASDYANYITGQVLAIDGGMTM